MLGPWLDLWVAWQDVWDLLEDFCPLMRDFAPALLAAFEECFHLGSDANALASDFKVAFNVIVSAVALLAFVYLYLIGYVIKAYSSSSLDFRDTYVSIVLFLAAYVWIKFRQAGRNAATPGGRKRKASTEITIRSHPIKDTESGRTTGYEYEPRVYPPRVKIDNAISSLTAFLLAVTSKPMRRLTVQVRSPSSIMV